MTARKLSSIFTVGSHSPAAQSPSSPKSTKSVPSSPRPCRLSLDGGVDRGGMPCSAELFDLFKLLAGDSSNGNLSVGEPGNDDDETEGMPDTFSDQSSSSSLEKKQQQDTSNSIHPITTRSTATESSRPIEQHLVEENLRDIKQQQDTFSSRFTALSLSNLPKSLFSHPTNQSSKKRPALPLPALDVSPEVDIQPPHVETATLSIPDSSNTSATALEIGDLSDEERLAAITDEFGNIADLYIGGEKERLLAESKGSLLKGVMMIGNFHLTTHRLLFHAFLPPDTNDLASQSDSHTTTGSLASTVTHQPDVIQSGPVNIHHQGSLRPTKRVWMELSSEMVTTYPSADEAGRVRPLRCILLSSISEVDNADPEHPCDFYVTYDTPSGQHRSHITVDTEQSAGQWRRAFHAALFRHLRYRWRETGRSGSAEDWSVMRVCIPLDRVSLKGISAYHSFAMLIGLNVRLDAASSRPGDWLSHVMSEDRPPRSPSASQKRHSRGESIPRRTLSLHCRSSSPAPARSSPISSGYIQTEEQQSQSELEEDNDILGLNIAVLNEQAWFSEAVQSAIEASTKRQFKPGVTKAKVILEIGGHDCLATDEDLDLDKSGSADLDELDEEDSDNGLLRETRKKEKAAMAAKKFGLKEQDGVWIKRCYVGTSFLPARGHVILNSNYICFWRRVTVGQDIKYRFPIKDVKGAVVAPGLRAKFHGMALQIHGHADLRFEFWNKDARDEVLTRINALCAGFDRSASASHAKPWLSSTSAESTTPTRVQSPVPTLSTDHPADVLAPPKDLLFRPISIAENDLAYLPYVANNPLRTTKILPRTFVCLTIGSRGDVQPYIALGLRLMRDDHRVIIVTHGEFKTWIEGYGIEHRPAGGDPTALMKLSQEHKMFSPGFFKESLGSFRQWLDDLLLDSWKACQGADVLIESPSTMSGIHIAEALKIPYFRAFTMPWTRTTAYPQAFLVPAFEMGPSFNYSTYVLFDNIMWKATAGQINRWRKHHLHLKATDMSALSVTKVPFLYNFSPSVVPKPLDWHDDVVITGYWNLEDSDTDWLPSAELEVFMAKARKDGKPLVYIGFGSIVVPRPNAMTISIIKAVEKADVRAIIAKGWSSRGADPAKEGEDIQFPSCCFGVDKVPHSWLFPRVQAALHHGGAGTVGASLRAGIPTLIKPWFGDQFFWSTRVAKLGVGLKVPSLRADDIVSALIKATSDPVMIEKATRIGERIRSENGVETAVQAITYNLSRAASDRRKMRWAK